MSAWPRRWYRIAAIGLVTAAILGVGLAVITSRGGTEPEARLPPTAVPRRAEVKFRLAVIGDYGTGGSSERAIAAQVRHWAATAHPDALVTTGDNVYPHGESDRFDQAWRRPYGWIIRGHLRLVASLGNHDEETSEGQPVMGLLGMPARWYVTRIGNADLFVLDANEPNNPQQLAWLRAALKGSTTRWRIAVFHQPAFSCSRHGTTAAIVRAWVPLFEAGGIDLVLSGHDHNYQRFTPRRGVVYIVAGGSGAGLYKITRCRHGEPRLAAGNDHVHSFVAIEGSTFQLRAEAIAADGRTLDSAVVATGPG